MYVFALMLHLQAQALSDTTRITLVTSRENLPSTYIMPLRKAADSSIYKGIPGVFDQYAIYSFDLQPEQSLYYQYRAGLLTEEEFRERTKWMDIDTAALAKEYIRQALSIYSGISGNTRTIIVDSNNNNDFGDEDKVVYQLKDLPDIVEDSIKSIGVAYEYYYDHRKYDRQLYIKALPYSSGDIGYSELQVYFTQDQHQVGNFTVNGHPYLVSLPEATYVGGNYDRALAFINEDGKWKKFTPFLYVGDTFQLKKDWYVFTNASVFGDQLDLVRLSGMGLTKGRRPGNRFPFEGFTDLHGRQVLYKDYFRDGKRKLLLLDFWGTWCKPCIEAMPKLAELAAADSRLVVVSIACDDDARQVEKFTSKNGMVWDQGFVPRWNKSIAEELRVDCFPTYMLIDENMTILDRSCGGNLEVVRSTLHSLPKE